MPTPSIFTSIINFYLPEPQASLLNGIIFGVDIKTSKVFYEQLKIVGLLHIVVLSGMNITILSTIIAQFTNSLGKQISILITILIIFLFILFVGPKAPVVRAGFMGILTLVAILSGRKNYSLWGLFLSAIFTVIFWPQWIKTISFQLSYGATLGLILFGGVKMPKKSKKKLTKMEIVWQGLKFFIWNQLKPTLAAQIFTVPLIFLYFKQASLVSPLSNVLIGPIIPSLMVFGLLTAFLGKINFYLGLPFAYICLGLLNYIVFVIEKLSSIPFVFINF